jgi:hypothetical protein
MPDQTIETIAVVPLGEVRDYSDLHRVCRARAETLNVSRLTIDDAAGLTSGHSGKLLAPEPMKRMGPLSMKLVLGALRMKLIAVEDQEAPTHKLVKRGPMPPAGTVHWRQRQKAASDELPTMKMPPPTKRGTKWAIEMNARRRVRLSVRRRTKIARNAAAARRKE